MPVLFVILNHNMDYAWLIDAEEVRAEKTGKIKTQPKPTPHT